MSSPASDGGKPLSVPVADSTAEAPADARVPAGRDVAVAESPFAKAFREMMMISTSPEVLSAIIGSRSTWDDEEVATPSNSRASCFFNATMLAIFTSPVEELYRSIVRPVCTGRSGMISLKVTDCHVIYAMSMAYQLALRVGKPFSPYPIRQLMASTSNPAVKDMATRQSTSNEFLTMLLEGLGTEFFFKRTNNRYIIRGELGARLVHDCFELDISGGVSGSSMPKGITWKKRAYALDDPDTPLTWNALGSRVRRLAASHADSISTRSIASDLRILHVTMGSAQEDGIDLGAVIAGTGMDRTEPIDSRLNQYYNERRRVNGVPVEEILRSIIRTGISVRDESGTSIPFQDKYAELYREMMVTPFGSGETFTLPDGRKYEADVYDLYTVNVASANNRFLPWMRILLRGLWMSIGVETVKAPHETIAGAFMIVMKPLALGNPTLAAFKEEVGKDPYRNFIVRRALEASIVTETYRRTAVEAAAAMGIDVSHAIRTADAIKEGRMDLALAMAPPPPTKCYMHVEMFDDVALYGVNFLIVSIQRDSGSIPLKLTEELLPESDGLHWVLRVPGTPWIVRKAVIGVRGDVSRNIANSSFGHFWTLDITDGHPTGYDDLGGAPVRPLRGPGGKRRTKMIKTSQVALARFMEAVQVASELLVLELDGKSSYPPPAQIIAPERYNTESLDIYGTSDVDMHARTMEELKRRSTLPEDELASFVNMESSSQYASRRKLTEMVAFLEERPAVPTLETGAETTSASIYESFHACGSEIGIYAKKTQRREPTRRGHRTQAFFQRVSEQIVKKLTEDDMKLVDVYTKYEATKNADGTWTDLKTWEVIKRWSDSVGPSVPISPMNAASFMEHVDMVVFYECEAKHKVLISMPSCPICAE